MSKSSYEQLLKKVAILENELTQLRAARLGRVEDIISGNDEDDKERTLSIVENETISRISHLFLSSRDMSDIYEKIPVILKEQFNYPITGIIEYDTTSDEIMFRGSVGIPSTGRGNPRFPAGETVAGTAIKTGKAIVDLDAGSRADYTNPILRLLNVRTFICEPIFMRETATGALIMADTRVREEAPRIARTLRTVADYFSREISRKQMEDSLRESEELTRNLMFSVNEGVTIFDRDLRIILWNKFMEELTGFSAQEVVGKSMPESNPHIDSMEVLGDLKRALAGETFRSEDLEFDFDAAGRKGWVIGQYMPLKNSQGEIIGIIASIRDITERKMAELSLGRTQEDLRETLEATTDGIWTWPWHGKTDEYFFSPRYYSMLGYDPGEFPATFRNFKALIHPDDVDHALAVIQEYVKSSASGVYENEYRMKTKTGKYRWVRAKARAVERDEQGKALRIIGNQEDITDRKLAEQGLESQLAINMALAGLSGSIISQSYSIGDIAIITMEYAKLLTDSDLGFVSEINADAGGIVVHAATKMMLDEHRNAENNKRASASGPDAGLWGHALHDRQPFFTNAPLPREPRSDLPGGSQAITRFLSVPVLFDNEVVGQIALANAPRDYTDNDLVVVRRLGSLYAMAIIRMRGEDRIKDSLHEKEVLIKELHHRVKNNLQVVSSLLTLQSRKVDDEKYRAYFEESRDRIHAMALVHEKLYNSGDMAKIDFASYLNDLTRHLFYTYNTNRHLVRLCIEVNDICLGIDTAVPCAMIINELISNSLKHGFPAGRAGEISISLNKDTEGKHTLSVSDTGVGVLPDFDIRTSGSLGMQIVQSLTRQIRGTIAFDGSRGMKVEIIF